MALNDLNSGNIEETTSSKSTGVIGKIAKKLHNSKLAFATLAMGALTSCGGSGGGTTPNVVDPFPTTFSVSNVVSNQDTNTLSFTGNCADGDGLIAGSCVVGLTRNPTDIPVYNNTVPSLSLNHEQGLVSSNVLSDGTPANTTTGSITAHFRAGVFSAINNNNQFATKNITIQPAILNLVASTLQGLPVDITDPFAQGAQYTIVASRDLIIDATSSVDPDGTIINLKITSDLAGIIYNSKTIQPVQIPRQLGGTLENLTIEITDNSLGTTISNKRIARY